MRAVGDIVEALIEDSVGEISGKDSHDVCSGGNRLCYCRKCIPLVPVARATCQQRGYGTIQWLVASGANRETICIKCSFGLLTRAGMYLTAKLAFGAPKKTMAEPHAAN